MIGALFFFFFAFLSSLILSGSASECQVSPWREWSDCFGDCETALVVRNRDVTVPPLPTPGHRISFRPCPHLYEVKSCKPKDCLAIKEDMPTPGPLPMMKRNKGSKETRKGKELKHPVFKGTKTQNSEESPLSLDRQELLPFTATTVGTTVDSVGAEKMNGAQGMTTSSAPSVETGSTERTTGATTEGVKTTKEYYISTLTLDLPIKSRLTADGEKRLKTKLHIDKLKYRNFADLLTSTADPIMNDVLRQLETAAENNAPLDEKQIRSALKKNKKLVKALVDAYRNRQGGSGSGNSTTASAEEKTTSSSGNATETTIVSELNKPSTTVTTTTAAPETTTTPKFWPKQGYVPNTRKHASEITSKLYMTREIIQALSEDPMRRSPVLNIDCLENRRCCKVARETCANGAEPVKVKRYYRPRGSSECVAYEYPRCSQVEEMDEQPIQFIQNCQDLCFNTPEKRISPLYALSREV